MNSKEEEQIRNLSSSSINLQQHFDSCVSEIYDFGTEILYFSVLSPRIYERANLMGSLGNQ